MDVNKEKTLGHRAWLNLLALFSLKMDKADDEVIDATIRAGTEIRGTNLWVLMFAIFIASIGLNVNSTAVIIGAMLISPLMGPIMGIGYGLGIFDFVLIRKALKNLAIATFISVCVSTLYFLLSPLTQAQSEILARTTPTIWDVLIALFGGLAGIIGTTRKEKSNVIPGVAIATALMPPLCVASFGLANQHWLMFGGAFYLFLINCVFIAVSSALVVRGFHIKKKSYVDEKVAQRVRVYVWLVAMFTVVPSIYLAVLLVKDEVFKSDASRFVAQEFNTKQVYVAQTKIDSKTKLIEVTTVGDHISDAQLAEISSRLKLADLGNAQLKLHQQEGLQFDLGEQQDATLSDYYKQNQQTLMAKDQKIKTLETALNEQKSQQNELKSVAAELETLLPKNSQVLVSEGIQPSDAPIVVVNARTPKNLSSTEQSTLQNWLNKRITNTPVQLIVQHSAQ